MAETSPAQANKPSGLKATLVYGQTYYLGNKRFEAGKPVSVTAEEAEALRGKSVPRTIIDGDKREVSHTPRFKIEGEASGPRKRTRPSKGGDAPESPEELEE